MIIEVRIKVISEGGDILGRCKRKTSGVLKLVYILIEMLVTQEFTYIKIHPAVHLRSEYRKLYLSLPRWRGHKESTCQCRRRRFNRWVRKIPWRRKWQPTPVYLPGESHGQRSLVSYRPWGCKSRTQLK